MIRRKRAQPIARNLQRAIEPRAHVLQRDHRRPTRRSPSHRNRRRTSSKTASGTVTLRSHIASAIRSAAFSASLKRALVSKFSSSAIFSKLIPSCLPTAELISIQNGQPTICAVRIVTSRLTILSAPLENSTAIPATANPHMMPGRCACTFEWRQHFADLPLDCGKKQPCGKTRFVFFERTDAHGHFSFLGGVRGRSEAARRWTSHKMDCDRDQEQCRKIDADDFGAEMIEREQACLMRIDVKYRMKQVGDRRDDHRCNVAPRIEAGNQLTQLPLR